MRVVFLSRLFPPHTGGVEKHVLEVSKELIRQGHEVIVITEKYSDKISFTEKINGIQIYRIAVGGEDWFKKFRIWREMWRLKKVWHGADVIHAHDVFFWYLPFRLFSNKKVYTTFHGYETVFPVSEKAKLVRKVSEKLSAGNICVGDFIKKWYGTRPSFVTYGGVAISKNTKFASLNKSKITIAFIGRLDADTGFIFYQQVVQLLHTKNIPFTVEIYGDGALRKLAEKIGRVHGFVPHIEKEIQKADIIFASSYLSMLESMAQYKPIFSTYSNPLKKDYLKMTPFAKLITIENDPGKMTEKIVSYVKNQKNEKEKIESAYQWVSQQTWEKLTDTYLLLWVR